MSFYNDAMLRLSVVSKELINIKLPYCPPMIIIIKKPKLNFVGWGIQALLLFKTIKVLLFICKKKHLNFELYYKAETHNLHDLLHLLSIFFLLIIVAYNGSYKKYIYLFSY